MSRVQSRCFVFVCHGGALEPKAVLLAASLRRHAQANDDLIGAVPAQGPAMSPTAAEALKALGVRLVPVTNPISADYPIGNKLACLEVARPGALAIFLDSDMLCLRPCDLESGDAEVHVKPVDLPGFAAEPERWANIYGACGEEVPTEQVHATLTGDPIFPYFNAGFVATSRGPELGAEWRRCATILDADAGVRDKRPWLDQLALPVAMRRLRLRYSVLDERFNFPAHLKRLPLPPEVRFCHYHTVEVVRREPTLDALVRELALEHPPVARVLDLHQDWRDFARARALYGTMSPGVPPPELVVTGLPRSGTSFLCKLIHSVPDCVVLNEPTEIFELLTRWPVPWGLHVWYGELRRDVLEGKAISNKLQNGEFIEDTAVVDKREEYRPSVGRPDFLLGTKNTLAYMARLRQLRIAMPRARIVACIRHPYDTLASWIGTFPHLRQADMDSQPLGGSRDAAMEHSQRERLHHIAQCAGEAERRALLWAHLARNLLEGPEDVVILRYEDLVADPAAAVSEVLRPFSGFGPAGQGASPQAARQSRRAGLTAEDYLHIEMHCREVAAAFGYLLDAHSPTR